MFLYLLVFFKLKASYFLFHYSLGDEYTNMYMYAGDATGSPQTLEKWREKTKLVISGAKEMTSVIVSKIFKCQDLNVLGLLFKALRCLHRVCSNFTLCVSYTKIRKPKLFESIYNSTHPRAFQMDCFQLSVEIRDFLGHVKPFLEEIENDSEMIELYRIAYLISHFLQDFVVANCDFHTIPPPYVRKSRRRSTWTY